MRNPWRICLVGMLLSSIVTLYISVADAAEDPGEVAKVAVLALVETLEAGGSLDVRPVVAHGASAVAPIMHYMNEASSLRTKTLLFNCLRNIEAEESTKALFDYALSAPQAPIRAAARSCLQERTIPFLPTNDEIELIRSGIRTGSVNEAGDMSNILVNCAKLPVMDALPVLAERFKRELTGQGSEEGISFREDLALLRSLVSFTRALSKGGEPGILFLRKMSESESNKDLLLWLLLARGYSGDAEAGKPILGVVHSKEHAQVRRVAVYAYAKCMDRDAIAELLPLLKDETISRGYPHRERPIALAAHYMLSRLKLKYGLDIEIGPPPRADIGYESTTEK